MEKISVIIPIYKVERYIADTVQSVLDQTYQKLEVLIIDDASPDRSVEICQQFNDPRLSIIQQENRGPSGALNTGIRHARGEYIALLDGDDLWLPDKLEKHINHLESSPALGVSFSRSSFIDEEGKSLNNYSMPPLKGLTVYHLLRGNPLGNGSAAVYRRRVFKDIEFQDNLHGYTEKCYFDERLRMSQDIECLLRIALQTDWQIEGMPEPLTLYRITAGGVSSNLLKKVEAWEGILNKLESYNSGVIAPWKKTSMAYELKYLARKAIRIQEGQTAVKLINRALMTHWQLLLEEPPSTVMTFIGAYLLWLMPRSFYRQIEAFILLVTGAIQRQRIFCSQSKQLMLGDNKEQSKASN